MRRIFEMMMWAAALQLVSTGANASGLEFSPAAKAGFEWYFGAFERSANHMSLNLAAGYSPTYGDSLRFESEQIGPGNAFPLQPGILPLIDARISTAPGTDALRVAGFSVLARATSQAAVNGDDQS
jgi:hypothetical protein